MPKKKSKKDKDFQKVKFKVGKKLPRAENVTSTAFRSKSIVIKEQLKETSSADLRQDVLKRSRNPQELLAHLQHYNPSFKLNSLNTIKAIMISDPLKLMLHIGTVMDRVCSLASDRERDIRAAVFECLRGVFSSLSEDAVVAFMPTINAHLRCAMTHLSDDVKLDSLQFLEILVSTYPSALSTEIFKLTQNFLDLISTHSNNGKRALKVSPNSKLSTANWRQQAFRHLERLLSLRSDRHVDVSPSPVNEIMEYTESRCHQSIDDSMYLSLSGLEEYSIRRREIGASTEESEDVLLVRFINEIIPLLRETWVELVVSTEGALMLDSCSTIHSVLNIISQLENMVQLSDIKDKQPMKTLIGKEIQFFVSNGFPLSNDDRRSAKGAKKAKTQATTSEVDCVTLNLRMCSLCSRLQCGNQATQFYMNRLVKKPDDIHRLGANIDTVLQCIQAGETVEKVIVNMIARNLVNGTRAQAVLELLDKQILSNQGIQQETVEALLKLASKEDMLPGCRVTTLKTVNAACNRKLVNLKLKYFLPVYTSCLSLHNHKYMNLKEDESMQSGVESDILRVVFTLLNHVEAITETMLKSLLNTLWQPYVVKPDQIRLLLQTMHTRAHDSALSMPLFISFLCTLVGGDETTESTDGVRHSHLSDVLAPIVFSHINTSFTNSYQVTELIESYFSDMKEGNNLTAYMCYSLLMNAGEWSTEFLLKVITTILDKEYPDLNTKEVTELNKECLERLLRIPITTDVYNTLEGDVSDYMHLITTPSHMEHLGEYVDTTQDNFTDRVTENAAEGTLECDLHVFYYCMRLLILSIKISNNKNKEKITLICTALKPKIKRICVETKAIVPYV